MDGMGRRALKLALLLPLALGLFFPVLFLLWRGFSSLPSAPVFSDPFLIRVIALTYGQAFLSALLSGIVGGIAAIIYSENHFLGRKFLWRVSLACFSLPSILVALSMLEFWGPRYGWFLVLVAHVFFNFPLFLKSLGTALLHLDRTEEMVALSLGASRWQCFWRVTARKLWPIWGNCFVLAFLYCSSSFLLILLLGGGPKFTTLEVAIYQAIKVDFDLSLAARLALIQIVVSFLFYAALMGASSTVRLDTGRFIPLYAARSRLGRARVAVLAFFGFFLLVVGPLGQFLGSGIFALIHSSIDWAPLWTSIRLALGVGALSSAYCLFLAKADQGEKNRVFGLLAGLPLAISPLLLLFSLTLFYSNWILDLRGSLVPILLVQSLAALPLVMRPLQAGFEGISPPLFLSARSLGANRVQVFKWVEWPILWPFLLLGFLYGMTFSLGEVGSVLLFLSEDLTTLPLEIFRSIGNYRWELAGALGTVLFLLTLGLQLLLSRWER